VRLPETISVKFTEEDAEYVSVRPIRRQTFRLRELVDMILTVTGRDAARIRQILRSGTVVYHFFRYSWQGFDADPAELAALLAEFPADLPPADPRRIFDAAGCSLALIESPATGRAPIKIERAAAERKSLFASRSFWDSLLSIAEESRNAVVYVGYSYGLRADAYRLDLSESQASALRANAAKLAPRPLRAPMAGMGILGKVIFLCPRKS